MTLAAHLAVVALLGMPLAGMTPLAIPWSLTAARVAAVSTTPVPPTPVVPGVHAHSTSVPNAPLPPATDRPFDLAETDPWLVPPTRQPAPASITASLRAAFVGDSVMVGAAPALKVLFGPTTHVDAAIRRQFSAGLDAARTLVAAEHIGDVVVVHLGSNGPLNDTDLDELMGVLRDVPYVFFLTVKVPRRWEESVNTALTAGVTRWPNATLIDWRTASYHRPDLFMDDGIHLMPDGRRFYAQLVLDAVTERLQAGPPNGARPRRADPPPGVAGRAPQDATT